MRTEDGSNSYATNKTYALVLAALPLYLRKSSTFPIEVKHKHSVYEHHPNAIRITGEDAFMQKVNYIHLNPVRAGLVDHPDDYLTSSARQWHRREVENDPLLTDHLDIKWRSAA